MWGKASIPFFMPDGIKITERWRSALSYGRHCQSSAGDDRFAQEITEKCISVTSAGTRRWIWPENMLYFQDFTSHGAVFCFSFFGWWVFFGFFRKIGNISLAKCLSWLIKSVIWSLSKQESHIPVAYMSYKQSSRHWRIPTAGAWCWGSTHASFSPMISPPRQSGSPSRFPAFPAFSSATEHSPCTASGVSFGSVTSQMFLTPSSSPKLEVT